MQCPHCRLTMQDAPELAGQIAFCPGCGGHFTLAATAFDPYYTWLGIPPEESAGGRPNHYRLLGLRAFESNPEVIQNAADRQMLHLRSYQMGPNAALSQRLLNEIALARVTLLDATKKHAYDNSLRTALAPRAATPQSPIGPHATPLAAPASDSRPRGHPASSRWTAIAMSILVVGGGVLGLALGVLIVFYATGRDVLGWSAKLQSGVETKDAEVPGKTSNARPHIEPPNLPTSLPSLPPALPPQRPAEPAPIIPPQPFSAPPSRRTPPAEHSFVPRPPRPPPLPQEQVAAAPPALVPIVRELPPWVALPGPLSREPTTLATLPGHKGDPIELKLHSAFAALPEKSQLIGQADADGEALTIHYVASDTATDKAPVATVRRDGTDLKFQWADSTVDSSIRRQLCNCIVAVSMGGRSRMMQLREPLPASPMILDLYDNNKDFEFQIEDLPKASQMRLKSLSLDDFPLGTLIRGGDKEREYNKSVLIDFVEMKGAQVRLRLLQQPKTKALLIRAEPTIKESASREYEMTMTGFDKLEAAQTRLLAESQVRITQLKRAFRDAQDSLDWLM